MTNQEIAQRIFGILVDVGGADMRDEQLFVRFFLSTEPFGTEFRFQGHLGFGGKFRRRQRREGTEVYVDYYAENEGFAREPAERVNIALAEALVGTEYSVPAYYLAKG